MQHLTDEEVMLDYQKGTGEAMDELLRRYKNPVAHFAYRLIADNTEALDVAQEVFLKVHQSKDTYVPSAKFSTWIFSIAHNICVSRLRKKRRIVLWPRRADEPEELAEFQSPDPSPAESVATDEMSDIVKKNIQALPFLQREALILCEYQDLDYGQIAGILKKSLGTVKTLIHRARMNLKTRLLPYIEEFQGGPHE